MKKLTYLLLVLLSAKTTLVNAQSSFTAGNMVVYRVGDGNTTLSINAAPVYLDEYTPAGVLVQSIAMPTVTSGSNSLLTANGNLISQGMLSLSADRKWLIVPGINTPVGSSSVPTANVIGMVDFNGRVNTSTVITDAPEASRRTTGAASSNGNTIWFGTSASLRYTTKGSSTSTLLHATNQLGSLAIANNQLYCAYSGASFAVGAVGTGLPATGGQSIASLPGLPNDIQTLYQFAFADLNPAVPGVDVLYLTSAEDVADPVVGIRKFSLVGGMWVDNGSAGGDVDNTWYQGLTVQVTGSVVTVFATRKGSSGNNGGEIIKLTDNSGYNGTLAATPSVIVSVTNPGTKAFRGLALVPQPAPFTPGNIVAYRIGDGSHVLSFGAEPIFLDEYTPTGTLVQSIAMPTTAAGAHTALTGFGNRLTQGMVSLSADGKWLVVPGINTPPGSSTASTANVIALVDFNGKINTTTAITDASEDSRRTRTAVSTDGNKIWFTVANTLRYTTAGSNTSTSIASSSQLQHLAIADQQLYASYLGSSPTVGKVGTGLPTNGGQSITSLTGLSTDIQTAYQFAFADLDTNTPGADVLYVTSAENVADPAVGIRKFSLVSGNWVDNGSIGGHVDNTWYLGLAVKVTGNSVIIFATRKGNSDDHGGQIVSFTDNSGYNGTISGIPTVIASVAVPNTMSFRGLALAPSGCPPVLNLQIPEIAATQAKITWTAPAEGSGNYEYAITNNATPPTSGITIANASETITGLTNATTYYAHVRNLCGSAGASGWTTVSFSTGCQPMPVQQVAVTMSTAGTVKVQWRKVFGAAGYEYLVSTSATAPAAGTAVTDTIITTNSLQAVTRYYIHIRSNCGGGSYSAWTTKPFTTGCFMPAPDLVQQTKVTGISWNKISNAVNYEYALTSSITDPISGIYITDTAYAFQQLNIAGAYYFHVRSVCTSGTVSEWAAIRLTTEGIFAYPNPVKDKFQLQLNATGNNYGQLVIVDAMGSVIIRMKPTNNTPLIHATGWAPGIYSFVMMMGSIRIRYGS